MKLTWPLVRGTAQFLVNIITSAIVIWLAFLVVPEAQKTLALAGIRLIVLVVLYVAFVLLLGIVLFWAGRRLVRDVCGIRDLLRLRSSVPRAWVPGPECEGTIDIQDRLHSIAWPRTDHFGHCDRIRIVFMHAPPYRLLNGGPLAEEIWTPDTRFGIEVQSSGASAPDIVLYVSLSGVIILYEADMDEAPREQIPRQIGAGEWISILLEKHGETYSVVINGEPVWQARRRHTKNKAAADVELWAENVRIRSRLFTNDAAARVIVREFRLE